MAIKSELGRDLKLAPSPQHEGTEAEEGLLEAAVGCRACEARLRRIESEPAKSKPETTVVQPQHCIARRQQRWWLRYKLEHPYAAKFYHSLRLGEQEKLSQHPSCWAPDPWPPHQEPIQALQLKHAYQHAIAERLKPQRGGEGEEQLLANA